ncbi:unnamed protein product [Rhizophagus irregularis]|nr:unnamed protein product [Rhizophagus irregularis]
MYKEKEVYFISNLTNLDSELCQFQESDISSLSGLVLCSKNEKFCLYLPTLYCFIKFIYYVRYDNQSEHILKHEDEGLGWIEYQSLTYKLNGVQILIEINSIEMQMDYVRYGETFKDKYFSRKEMENLLDLNDILSKL